MALELFAIITAGWGLGWMKIKALTLRKIKKNNVKCILT